MSQRITIDPITRIEGHLRIDLEVDGGKISKAYSSGTMWRGIEVILQGRDPRDAWVFTQRICGVCTTVHAIASVRSVESALGLEIPLNAQLIRNIIISAHAQHDHIVHFYHLSALDWVDVVSALKADVGATAALAAKISDWPGNSAKALGAVKEKLTSFVKAGQLGPFTNGYWGHPAMKLSPEVNLLAVAHYLQALDIQRKANQVVAILGSKTPNIQNLAVGGVANAINLDNPATLNMEKLYQVKVLLDEIQAFTTQCYLVDVAAVAGFYPDWFKYGAGITNYLAVPDMPTDAAMSKFDLPGGIIMTGAKDVEKITDWKKTQPFIQKVTEGVSHSYYEGKESRHPWQGETKPSFKTEEINWKPETAAPEKYSWVKSPRLDGKPMQVGPLAQVLVGFLTGHELTTKYVVAAIKAVKAIHNIDVTPAMLHSTLGRHAARAIRCAMMGELSLKHWGLLAANIGKGDTAIFVDPMANLKAGTVYEGVGLHEAPRGTLSHWCVIESDGKGMKLKNYQAVVPSTWNAGPRDEKDQAGPYEACLVGNPIADPKLPLEALRTVHSFDPCLACAIHTHDADGNEISQVKVGV